MEHAQRDFRWNKKKPAQVRAKSNPLGEGINAERDYYAFG